MSENMSLWRSVEKTDPSHTKKVNQRGGFTSISAHYQVMRATEEFGPVGTGWGYSCGEPIFHGSFVIVPVSVWYRDRANTFGPVYGAAEMMGNRPDSDAPKKAMTDALTKALSHLGFSADVFLGKFDDNKYVAGLQAEFAGGRATEADKRITDAQADTIRDWIEATASDEAKFCKAFGVAEVDELPATKFGAAIKALERKQQQAAA